MSDARDRITGCAVGRRLLRLRCIAPGVARAGRWWLQRWRRWLVVGCVALIVAIACDRWVGATGGERIAPRLTAVPQRRAILVLGTAPTVWDRPNRYYEARLDAAAQLFAAGRAPTIIVSGDHGRQDYDEPGSMKRDLMARGVPAAAVVTDHAGFRTLDSVLRCRSVFGVADPIIVSQPFHLERALFLAQARGLDAVGYPARQPRGVLTWRIRLREVASRCVAALEATVLPTEARFMGPPEPLP